jgi:hypothetical protein
VPAARCRCHPARCGYLTAPRLGGAFHLQFSSKIAMHWTPGGAAPKNCQYDSRANGATGSNLLHVALQSSEAGWVSLHCSAALLVLRRACSRAGELAAGWFPRRAGPPG